MKRKNRPLHLGNYLNSIGALARILCRSPIVAGLVLAPGFAFGYQLPSAGSSTARYSGNVSVLQQMSNGVSEIAAETSSAIVFVSVAKVMRSPFGNSGQFNPFEFWFPEMNNRSQRPSNPKPQKSGIGSGFFVDLDRGYVITNNHVVDGADEISLKLANGESYDAKVVGRDKNTDIAVVQIKDKKFNRKGLSSLVLADSDQLKTLSKPIVPSTLETRVDHWSTCRAKSSVSIQLYFHKLAATMGLVLQFHPTLPAALQHS